MAGMVVTGRMKDVQLQPKLFGTGAAADFWPVGRPLVAAND